MTYRGHIHNGQIVLDEPASLPDGSSVTVTVQSSAATPPSSSNVWDALLDLAGTVEGLPSDMAENHDHYIHGTPKRP